MIETKKNEIKKIKFFGQTIYHFSDLSTPDTEGDCGIVDAKESKEGNKRKKNLITKSDTELKDNFKRTENKVEFLLE